MQKYNIHLPPGTLALVFCKECPSSFLDPDRAIPTLLLYPSESADLSLTFVGEGALSYLDMVAALTYYFATIRGLPTGTLDINTPFGRLEIPLAISDGIIRIPLPPCRRIFTASVRILGVEERVSTVVEYSTTRIIENIERCPGELLSRLRVIDNMPTAARALSYKRTDKGYAVLSTDRYTTTDTLAPLVRLFAERGMRGELSVLSGNMAARFDIAEDGTPYALYHGISHSLINA